MDPTKRERLLQAGRKLLEERKKSGGIATASSMPSVVQPSLPDLSISSNISHLPSIASSSSISTTKALPRPILEPFLPSTSSPLAAVHITSPPLSPPISEPSPRDQNLQKRIGELTLERSEIAAKLFKQEKANEDLVSKNNLLRQRLLSFEKQLGNSQLLQDRLQHAEEQNRKLTQAMEQLQMEQQNERNDWNNLRGNMEEHGAKNDQLSKENAQLNQKLTENLRTFQETIEEKEEKLKKSSEKLLAQQKQIEQLMQHQGGSQNELKQWKEENEKLSVALSEKEQQLSILYKEAEQHQRETQDNRSFLNQKNDFIKQLQGQIASLKVENQKIAQKEQQEHLPSTNERLVQLQEALHQKSEALRECEEKYQNLMKEKHTNDSHQVESMRELINEKVEATGVLQEALQVSTEENIKLKETIQQYQDLLDNMQNTSNQISLSYDETISQTRAKYEDEIRSLLQRNNYLQGQVRSLSSDSRASSVPSDSLQQYKNDLEVLETLRSKHRRHKPDSTISVQEVQEEKIHQLLEEISMMESLVERIGVVQKIENVEGMKKQNENLALQLEECAASLDFIQREKQSLLDAIDSGDLSSFLSLQEEAQTQKEIQELNSQIALLEEQANNIENTSSQKEETTKVQEKKVAPKPPQKKKGWFW